MAENKPQAQRQQGAAQGAAAPTPSNLSAVAATVDPALATAPAAVQGQAVSDATTKAALEAAERAQKRLVIGTVGFTGGSADSVGGTVKPSKQNNVEVLVCPNCERQQPYTISAAGSSVPCVCGFLIQMPAL